MTQPLYRKTATPIWVFFLLVGILLLPPPIKAQSTSSSDDQYIAIDFNNVDISVFIKFIGELTGTNFLVDPRIKGKVTINSPSKITVAEAYRDGKVQFSSLRLVAFAAQQPRADEVQLGLRHRGLEPED